MHKASCVSHQVLHCDGTSQGHIALGRLNPEILELREPVRDRIIQIKASALDQHHGSYRHQGFGHRG